MNQKTLDEVIEYFNDQCKTRHVYLTEDADERFYDALHYLKMYRSDKLQWEADRRLWTDKQEQVVEARQKFIDKLKELDVGTLNEPLSWDELKTMEGKPVWVVVDGKERWHIIREVTNEHLILESGLPLHKCWMNHPDGWQAYRKERK